jgi:hypothetical protein
MDKLDSNGLPFQMKEFKLGDSRLPINVPVSCLDASDDLSRIAIGFCNGVVMLVSGVLLRDRFSSRMFHPESKDPITSLTFTRPEARSEATSYLFITTSQQTSVVTFHNNQESEVNRSIGITVFAFRKSWTAKGQRSTPSR